MHRERLAPQTEPTFTLGPQFDLKAAIARAKAEVYDRFPELNGLEPKYLARRIKSRPIISRYLIFRGVQTTEKGEQLIQVVRVYLTTRGEIARIIASKSRMESPFQPREEDV